MVNIVTNFYSIVFIVGLLAVLGYFILYAFLNRLNKANSTSSRYDRKTWRPGNGSTGLGIDDFYDPKKYV